MDRNTLIADVLEEVAESFTFVGERLNAQRSYGALRARARYLRASPPPPDREAGSGLELYKAFHEAWVECECGSATGDPSVHRDKRKALLALHGQIRALSPSKPEGEQT